VADDEIRAGEDPGAVAIRTVRVESGVVALERALVSV
jgi:hypothetical protein